MRKSVPKKVIEMDQDQLVSRSESRKRGRKPKDTGNSHSDANGNNPDTSVQSPGTDGEEAKGEVASRCHSPTCPHANGNPCCDQKSPLLNRRVVNRLAVGIAERMAQLGFLSPPQSKPVLRNGHSSSSGQFSGHSSGQSNGQKSPRTVGAKVTTPARDKSTFDSSKVSSASSGVFSAPKSRESSAKSPAKSPAKSSAILSRVASSASAYDESRFMNAQIIITAIKPNYKLEEKKQRFTAQVYLNTNDVLLYKEIIEKFNTRGTSNLIESDKKKKKRRVVISRGKKIGNIITSKRLEVLEQSINDRIRKMKKILHDFGYDTSESSIMFEDLTRMAQIRDGIKMVAFERLYRFKRYKTQQDWEAEDAEQDIEVDEDDDYEDFEDEESGDANGEDVNSGDANGEDVNSGDANGEDVNSGDANGREVNGGDANSGEVDGLGATNDGFDTTDEEDGAKDEDREDRAKDGDREDGAKDEDGGPTF